MPEQRSVLLVTKGLDLGGVERIVVDLATSLRRRGVAIEVAVVNDRRDEMVGLLDEQDIVVHRLGGSDHIGLRAALRLAALVRQQRFGVVHVHGPLPAVLARLTPGHRPIVTTSHTPLGALRPVSRVLWSLTARFDAATLAVSAVVAGSLPRRVRAGALVVPHGIDVAAIERTRIDGTLAGTSHDALVRVLVIASHREAKNYPNMLHAIRRAIDLGARLHVTAVGTGPLLADHRALAESLQLEAHITFVHPTLEILRVMAAHDLLVVASDYEGQPLVVLEALAMGVPVVATAVGRIPELVTPLVGRVVPPSDALALGGAIAELALDPDRRRVMSETARTTSHGWTLDQATEAHLAVYARVGLR